jgi:DNA-binding beta-propeller fold protein YncE
MDSQGGAANLPLLVIFLTFNILLSIFYFMKRVIPLLLPVLALAVQAASPATLKLVQTIPLPGVKGRFDHFGIDAKQQRLFVAALGNNTLEVVDLVAGKRIQSIPGMSKPTGVLYLPESNSILVANGNDGTVKVLDATSFKRVQNLTGLDDADNLRWDAKGKLAYLGYGEGALGFIDFTTFREIARVKLPAHPESFQLESAGPRIYVNVPEARQVAVIDREKRAIVDTWPMEKFRANFPMALDEANHRLLIGCRNPARLVVLDTASGGMRSDMPLSGDTDDLFYDPAQHRVYVSCGEGFIDVIDQIDANTYRLLERMPTRSGARTSFFSKDLNEFFLAVPQLGNQSAELRIYR